MKIEVGDIIFINELYKVVSGNRLNSIMKFHLHSWKIALVVSESHRDFYELYFLDCQDKQYVGSIDRWHRSVLEFYGFTKIV